eukprot:TRINITY_DN3397_c0_g1_i2.p1 TRINITY_DN3397_c0_g1~~TRINITY_DN3397_c0_g1_i2.p1  ORF type:complete len:412 (+),score=98.56 TRINITY_DN3397_c0_g1_i2:680-1915(+)
MFSFHTHNERDAFLTDPPIHDSFGAARLNFATGSGVPPQNSPQTPATTPSTGCSTSTLLMIGSGTSYSCMLKLSNAVSLHWDKDVNGMTAVAASAPVSGWLSVGFPVNPTSMVPSTVVSSSLESASIYSVQSTSASGITVTPSTEITSPVTEMLNGERVIRFNVQTSLLQGSGNGAAVIYGYHPTDARFPVNSATHTERGSSNVNFVSGTAVSLSVGSHDVDAVRVHGTGMIAIWSYWVPLAVVIKAIGPIFCSTSVAGYPLPFVVHTLMMIIAMGVTTLLFALAVNKFDGDVGYSHKGIGIAILVIGWTQVVGGFLKPENGTNQRKYWGWGHILIGVTIFVLAVLQMIFGIQLLKELYANESSMRDSMMIALFIGLVLFVSVYIVGKVYVMMTKEKKTTTFDKPVELNII